MTSKTLFVLVFISHCATLSAQQPMVAYRKEGIWYYFDTEGKSMWEPYADVAAMPSGWSGGLLKATAMDITGTTAADIAFVRQQVLYDKKGKVAFRPKGKGRYRIYANEDKVGFFHLTDFENGHLILCDKTGNIKYESSNATAQYFGDGVVAYLETEAELEAEGSKNYILYDVKAKKIIARIACEGIRGDFKNGSLFCCDDKMKWGMLDRKGTVTQAMKWDLIDEKDENAAVQEAGFSLLKDPKTELLSLFNSNGQMLLSDISEIVGQTKDFFKCKFKTTDADEKIHTYVLQTTQIKEISEPYLMIYLPTEGDMIVCEDTAHHLTLMGKNLKPIVKIPSFRYSALAVLEHHIWTQTSTANEYAYSCYDQKGNKIGTIEAETVGKPAYGHVPFMRNGKWGLATQSGQIVIKPTFTFKKDNMPEVNNGYWCIPVPTDGDNMQFDFYNFQGKMVLSTSSEKDGWDYIVQQEIVRVYRNF